MGCDRINQKFNNKKMKIKISKAWIVVIVIILLITGYYVIKSIFKSPTEGLVTENVVKGQVLQEVSETGSVKATEDVALGFKSVGKVSKIRVGVGDSVNRGDILADLDSSQLFAQLQSAKAALDYTANQYDTGVASARDNLQSAYNSAVNVLNDAYTKTYNAYNFVTDLYNSYFLIADQQGVEVLDNKNDLEQNMKDIKSYVDNAKNDSAIDYAISQTLISLDNAFSDLRTIREQCEQGAYYTSVSASDKSSLDTQKSYINTALTNVTASQTSISSYKIALQKAEDGAVTSDASGSQVQQAQANVDAIQSQLNDSYLISPIDGLITEINIKRGQIVSPSQSAINLLSTKPFEIKVYIYEQDIVNVKPGNKVKINLVAFPKQTFDGEVLSIDPAETIVDNIVYYKVTIEFPNQPQGIRSGMTADITIETNKKDDVLRVPKSALLQIDGTEAVQIVRNNKIQNQTITTGLEGNDYLEVTSGLKEGDQIVTGKK